LRFRSAISMLRCSDFKVFIAFSSIIHITILRRGVRLFNEYFGLVYPSNHTVLSAQMFYQFRLHYKHSRTRLINFFGGVFRALLTLVWLRLPPFILFVAEILQFQYFRFNC
jgi:formate hydrogenlyase subunit 3/multisubunit Na+/H+ antiporter MnhD subunit